MSKEYINGSDADANKQWAGLFYNDLGVRNKLIERLEITFLTDGNISFNKHEACSLINFMATEDNGVEWEPETSEEDKFQTVSEVVGHFFDMIVDGNSYLARFSVN